MSLRTGASIVVSSEWRRREDRGRKDVLCSATADTASRKGLETERGHKTAAEEMRDNIRRTLMTQDMHVRQWLALRPGHPWFPRLNAHFSALCRVDQAETGSGRFRETARSFTSAA